MSVALSTTLEPRETAFLAEAADYLEHPGFLMRAADLVGRPLDAFQKVLPDRVRRVADAVAGRALRNALRAALLTLRSHRGEQAIEDSLTARRPWGHGVAVGLTGALGGAFGLPALAIELPVTTAILLRNIAAVAQDLGENLDDPEARLHCLAVFSLAGTPERRTKLQAMESSYYASRIALSQAVQEAAVYAARVTGQQLAREVAAGTAPALVRLLSQIAARFNVVVHEKLVAQAVPILGAAGGALVNVAFQGHFHRLARYHFGIRALERQHGRERVQEEYQRIAARLGNESEPATA
jgi:hypothetical protein